MSKKKCFSIGKRQFQQPIVMGILNATPDSFYSGSRKQTDEEIAQRANEIISQGGEIIDVGACSTRPGSAPVSADEEMLRMRRALTVVKDVQPDALLSIDTFRTEVAQMAIEEFGAQIINDVSEGTESIFELAGATGADYILMSAQPDMETTRQLFDRQIERLHAHGCRNIILDPGYGFGKDIEQNFRLLWAQEQLLDYQLPLLVGVSRKRMIWQHLGITPEQALNGTTVINTLALERGADILRVHDVREAKEVINLICISYK